MFFMKFAWILGYDLIFIFQTINLFFINALPTIQMSVDFFSNITSNVHVLYVSVLDYFLCIAGDF